MLSQGQIERTERDMNALTGRIHETVKHRNQSDAKWEEWRASTKAFHTYENPVLLQTR